MTWHSQVHNLLGAVVFSLGPASMFVFFRRFRTDPRWRPLATWTLAAAVTMTAAVVLLKVATLPPPAPPNILSPWAGAIQRVAIVSLMAWVATVGVRMRRQGT
jgi:amino acid transporter